MATNHAAWLTGEKVVPFEVKEAPLPQPSSDEIVVKNHAVAINPVDWKIQREARFPLAYPCIIGEDISGIVQSVGPNVTAFKKGDRVASHTIYLKNRNLEYSGFQEYTRCDTRVTTKLPDAVDFNSGAVLPLAVSTASAGLFQSDYLNLPKPSVAPKPTNTTLLVWGGSSSVGALAIQLAKAAGVEVFTTASKHNHDLCKKLGADKIFDHTSPTVVDEIVDELKGKTLAGAYDAIAHGTTEKCAEILHRSKGVQFIATVLPPPAKLAGDVKAKNVFAVTILENGVAEAVWNDFLPKALEQGKLVPAPSPLVIGTGLESIQKGCDKNMEGVSAAKVVVSL